MLISLTILTGCDIKNEIPSGNTYGSEGIISLSPDLLSQNGDGQVNENQSEGIYFKDVEYNLRGSQISLEGTVLNGSNEPVSDVIVTLFCNKKNISNEGIATKADGFFFITGECEDGGETWVEVTYDGEVYVSKQFNVPGVQLQDSYSSDSFVIDDSNSQSYIPVGVPEFSTITLALAIIGGTLGFVFLRKN